MGWARKISAVMLILGVALALTFGTAKSRDAYGGEAILKEAVKTGDIVRLHIVADDDSETAQKVKLAVRDAFIEGYAPELSKQSDSAGVYRCLCRHINDIEATADEVLRLNGIQYGAKAQLGMMDFPDRRYGTVMVPAGRYMALRLELGRASGRNWWCVIYPSVCLMTPDLPERAEGLPAEPRSVVFRSALLGWLNDRLHFWDGGDV